MEKSKKTTADVGIRLVQPTRSKNRRGRIALTSTCKWRSLGFARRSAIQAWRDNCPYSTVAAELVPNTGSGSQTSRPSYRRN
jgi:hypothetical protein